MRWLRGHRAGEDGNVRRESCSCVVRSCRSRRAASGIEEAQVPQKSGTGVHGCLGRCRLHRLTTGANAAIEGTQGRVLVAAKPRRPPSSLMKNRKVFVGAAPGLVPGVERKLASMEGALGRGRGGPSRAFVETILDPSADHRKNSTGESGDSRRIDRGVRGSVGQATRGRKHLVIGATYSIRPSPLSRRETRCGSVARPKGRKPTSRAVSM